MSQTFNIIVIKPDHTIDCLEDTIHNQNPSDQLGWHSAIFRLMTEKYKCYRSISQLVGQYDCHWNNHGERNKLATPFIKTLKPIDSENESNCGGNCYFICFDASEQKPILTSVEHFITMSNSERNNHQLTKVIGTENKYEWKHHR
jgi:hypothetical protein